MRRGWPVLALCVACADATSPSTAAHVVLVGNAERGGSALVRVVRGADTLAAPVTVTLSPDSSRAVVRADTVRFTALGSVTIRAASGGVTADTALVVSAPPVLVYQASPAGNADLFAIDLDGLNGRPLATDPSEDAMPTVAQGRVVFVSRRSGSRELWSVPVAGGSATRLTTTAADEEQPALSADGAHLAWIVPGGGATAVWVGDGNAAGGARFGPADVFASPLEASPAWGPNGALAYATVRDSGTYVIYRGVIGGAVGSATRLVAGRADSLRLEPAYSTDGAWLALTTDRQGGPGTALLIADASTGAIVLRLVPGTMQVASPRWLDARRIVFVGAAPGGGRQLFWADRTRPGLVVPVPNTLGASRPAVVR